MSEPQMHIVEGERTRVKSACSCCLVRYDDEDVVANGFLMHEDYLPQQQQRQSQSGQVIDLESLTSSVVSAALKRELDEASHGDVVFSLPESDDLLVNGFDVSHFLHQLQLSRDTEWKHALEEHMHLALASTSVILLSPTTYSNDISPFISYGNWKATVNFIEKKYGIKRHPMPINAITGLLSIVDDLLADKINRKVAYSKIISMTLEKHLEKFAMALGQLVRRLPSEPIREDFGEAELCSRFVDPFLSGLFDNPDDDVYLRWTNVFNGKTNEQPAICITRFCGANWEMNVGYGEVQCAARDKDDHVICRDLLKLTVSCKEALDEQLMEGMLAIQVLGRTIKFYLLVLPATGLYALIDLAVIEVPDSLKSLPSLVTEAANIIKVLDIFERLCVPASDVATTMSRRTPTLSLSQLGQLFAISEHRKRPRHLRPQSN